MEGRVRAAGIAFATIISVLTAIGIAMIVNKMRGPGLRYIAGMLGFTFPVNRGSASEFLLLARNE
jgi:hypothetical protein